MTHLGRVDIVISAKIFFFCCEFRREERGKPDERAQTYPTYPGMLSAQAKKEYTCNPKKARRGGRAPQSSRNHRKANRREDRGEGGPPSEWG